MQMGNRIRQWWHRHRARKNHATQPVLTFDALLERAALRATPETRDSNDAPPDVQRCFPTHPKAAFARIGLALGGGAFLYSAIGVIVLTVIGTTGPAALVAVPPLLFVLGLDAMTMYRSFRMMSDVKSSEDASFLTFFRILLCPVTELSVLFVYWLASAFMYCLLRADHALRSWLSGRNKRPSASATRDRAQAMARLPDVLREIIARDREALVCKDSELTRLILRAETVVRDARAVCAHFERRARCGYNGTGVLDPNLPEHLAAARARAHAVVERLEARQGELEVQRRRIVVFYDDCLARAEALHADVDDLTLFARLQDVEHADEAIAGTMYDVIARSSTAVLVSAYRFRELLSDAFLETGVRTASAALDAPDATTDFATFEATIGRFVERATSALPQEPDVLSPHTPEPLTA